MQQDLHIAAFFTVISSKMFMIKISWNCLVPWSCMQGSFEKKLSKEEGRISALYLYINFSKLSWHKSETLRILSN